MSHKDTIANNQKEKVWISRVHNQNARLGEINTGGVHRKQEKQRITAGKKLRKKKAKNRKETEVNTER